MCWLTVTHINDEEFRRDLCYCAALLYEWWHHFVRLRCPNDQLLSILRVAKDVCVDQGLALITNHVAVHVRLFILQRHHHSHKLGHFEALRVWIREHLLHLSGFFDFFSC